MIRYRLGDLAAWDPEPCPCGRSMPVLKEVVGRIEDVVVGPDGRQMVRFHGIFVNQPHIIEGQIIQESLNQIHVKVVPTEGFGESDVQEIIHRVQQRLGAGVDVTVEPVERIPRTNAGKIQSSDIKDQTLISIILPIRNEATFIEKSLDALLSQDYPQDQIEILIADGMSTDGTREIIRQYQQSHPNILLIDNPGRIVPTGMNAAIREAHGEIIIRVDGHCIIAPDYVSNCVYHLLMMM